MTNRVAGWLSALPPWGRWLGIGLLLELAWFMWLHPLVPSSWQGFVIELGAGACVIAAVYWAARAIWWISKQQGHLLLWRTVAVGLALSVGVGVFLVAYEFRTTISDNFHYFIFAKH
jgi:hypothetical protein